jgi:hypothetical protein
LTSSSLKKLVPPSPSKTTLKKVEQIRIIITSPVMRAVAVAALCVICQLRRRLSAARTHAPTAPTAPASVGVAMPKKMLPSTAKISSTGGTMACSTRRKSAKPRKVRASGGSAGAASGRTHATPMTRRGRRRRKASSQE